MQWHNEYNCEINKTKVTITKVSTFFSVILGTDTQCDLNWSLKWSLFIYVW